jgi:hypothetical protein
MLVEVFTVNTVKAVWDSEKTQNFKFGVKYLSNINNTLFW